MRFLIVVWALSAFLLCNGCTSTSPADATKGSARKVRGMMVVEGIARYNGATFATLELPNAPITVTPPWPEEVIGKRVRVTGLEPWFEEPQPHRRPPDRIYQGLFPPGNLPMEVTKIEVLE